jgi:hypothetical protein
MRSNLAREKNISSFVSKLCVGHEIEIIHQSVCRSVRGRTVVSSKAEGTPERAG